MSAKIARWSTWGSPILPFALGILQFYSATPSYAAKNAPARSAEIAALPSPSVPESDASSLLRAKKWEEAVVVLRSSLRANPASDETLLDLARALTLSGRREEAVSLLSREAARAKGPRQKMLARRAQVLSRLFLTNATFQIYQDGINLLLAEKRRPARDRFERVLEAEPANVEALTRLGQCLCLDGDYDSAAEALRMARRLNEFEPDIQLWLGHALQQRGEVRESLIELKAARASLANSEQATIWYAEALQSAGQKPQAIQLLEKDSHENPEHVGALIALARLRLAGVTSIDDSTQISWQVRKDLQVALSRLPDYVQKTERSTNYFAMEQVLPEGTLKKEIARLMSEAEGRIEGLPSAASSPTSAGGSE